MKWYGILAFFILIGVLAGVVYLGMNTEKFYETKGNSIEDVIVLNCSDKKDDLSCFGNAFDACTPATLKHTMITSEGDPIYVIANITDDCKIHVIHDNREDSDTDPVHRKIIEAECNKLKIQDDFIDIENCTISENEQGSFRVWK
jgi:hypothetical protein